MLGGYAGRLLRVDLTTRTIRQEALSEEFLRKWMGGSGLGAYILATETGPSTDPLGPENRLVVSVGPLAGTPAPTSCRHEITAKSPLTGIFGESDCGGTFGAELKAAGFDAVVVSGAAGAPVYLAIVDGRAELRSAAHLWGKDTYATDEALRAEVDQRACAICIGTAGEKQVLIAAVLSGGTEGRAAGRTGLGAVMGAKRLKGIVARGTGRVQVVNPDALRESIRTVVPIIRENTPGFQSFGTAGSVVAFEQSGNLPLQNWRGGTWPAAANVSGQRMSETILKGQYHCKTCVIGCGREVVIDSGLSAGQKIAGPEYETIAALGSMCLVDDLVALSEANDLCNRYGIDTISTGGAVAFAMECFERGLLEPADVGGLDLTWGSAKAMLALVQLIGEAEGIGKVLGQGTRRAAAAIGKGAERYAMHVKGLELPMHDPRAFHSVTLGYATSNRGACHLQALSHGPEGRAPQPDLGYPEVLDRFADGGKGEMTAKMQNYMCMLDSLKVCKFVIFGKMRIPALVDWLNYTTGWNVDLAEFLTTGERIFNLKRLYNLACGVTSADDTLPRRLLTEPRPDGAAAGSLPDQALMLREYYQFRGWTPSGVPTPEKLAQLGLADVRIGA